MWQALLNSLGAFVQKFFELVVSILAFPAELLFQGIAIALSGLGADLSIFQEHVDSVDAWIDTDAVFTTISAYFGFCLALGIYRLVKSWIPLVG